MFFGENSPSSSLTISLKRSDRIYRPGEKVEGKVIVNAYKGWPHQGVRMVVDGQVHLNSTARGVGILDALSSGLKPIVIVREDLEIAPVGKFADGVTEVPFEFVLVPQPTKSLYESYHGVFINVVYTIRVDCDRGVLKKSLQTDMEFIVEIPSSISRTPVENNPSTFDITPETLENVNSSVISTIPQFKLTGRLHRTRCPIGMPFTGELIVESCDEPVKSIELQLVRVETIERGESSSQIREATEVQNIQIGEGDICRNMIVPMYMIFPRLFSCPSVTAGNGFKIEFEINLIFIFGDGYMMTENFPVLLVR